MLSHSFFLQMNFKKYFLHVRTSTTLLKRYFCLINFIYYLVPKLNKCHFNSRKKIQIQIDFTLPPYPALYNTQWKKIKSANNICQINILNKKIQIHPVIAQFCLEYGFGVQKISTIKKVTKKCSNNCQSICFFQWKSLTLIC